MSNTPRTDALVAEFREADGQPRESRLRAMNIQAVDLARELEPDAARYRWLRENWDNVTGNTWRDPIGPKLDAAIDRAIERGDKLFAEVNSEPRT